MNTPHRVVDLVWKLVFGRRSAVRQVLDFGAGDGRFAKPGMFVRYVGYEIDSDRCAKAAYGLPARAELRNRCAFSEPTLRADLCIGNPPYVRNQDLPVGWRDTVAASLKRRCGVQLSGLANAWQYFFLHALLAASDDGLIAIVIPYEWVSRPSARALREYIADRRWTVAVYRLSEKGTFPDVLTTASATIVDKAGTDGTWSYYQETTDGTFQPLASPSGSELGVLPYTRRPRGTPSTTSGPRLVRRGLSPGTQEVLTLTDTERRKHKLRIGSDVVRCVTSLRNVDATWLSLSLVRFNRVFRDSGRKCWLIRTDTTPSKRLVDYLASIPGSEYQTRTCLARDIWWLFAMPQVPQVIVSAGFRGARPKAVVNNAKVRVVGGLYGVYALDQRRSEALCRWVRSIDLSSRVVAHSKGLRKLETNQLVSLLTEFDAAVEDRCA